MEINIVELAATGLYCPICTTYKRWVAEWLYFGYKTRKTLVNQLQAIRMHYGNKEAMAFRNYLKWLGVYPAVKKELE